MKIEFINSIKIVLLLGTFSIATSCKKSDSALDFGAAPIPGFDNSCPTEENPVDFTHDGIFTAKDVEECILSSEIDRYFVISGVMDSVKIVQQNLAKVFGNTSFQIKVRHSDEKPYCLASSKDGSLSWKKCDDRTLNTQFYFARRPTSTIITNDASPTGSVTYDDYAFHIIPADELNFWIFDRSATPPRCITAGADFKLSLDSCGNTRDVWTNIPNSFKGDKALNIQNRFSNMALINTPKSIAGLLTESNKINEILDLPPGFARTYEGRQSLAKTVRDEPSNVDVQLNINPSSDLIIKDNPEPFFLIKNRNSLKNCAITAFDVVDDTPQHSCLNIFSSRYRDAKADGDVQDLIKKALKWSKGSNYHIVFVERCEGRLVPGVPAACNDPNPIRSLAEDRGMVEGSVVQLRSDDDKQCAYQRNGQVKYESCNQTNETGSHFRIQLSMDEASFPVSVDAEGKTDLMQDLWGFHSIVRPYHDGKSCLTINDSGSYEMKDGSCSKYKLRGHNLLLSGRLTTNIHKTQKIAYCKSALNIETGIEFDCHDYVSPALRRLIIAADVLSFIPFINVIITPILQGIVCNANEVSISGEGCMGLAMGLPIDMIMLPFDIMTAGTMTSAIKAAMTRTAIKTVIRKTLKEGSEEAVEAIAKKSLRSLADSTEGSILNYKSFKDNFKEISQRLSSEGVSNIDELVEFNKVIAREHTITEINMAKSLADKIVTLVKSERRINKSHVDNYIKAFFGKVDISDIKSSAYQALEQALFLDHRLAPKIRRQIATDLGTEVLTAGAGLALFGIMEQ